MGVEWFFVFLIIVVFGPYILMVLVIFMEFILRLFGKSFDDEPKKNIDT
tara:strand:- start:9805 stop:9951 length:147 start_codon:yes stop_codon:yes gene_type:complete